jgi:hypothetical protein
VSFQLNDFAEFYRTLGIQIPEVVAAAAGFGVPGWRAKRAILGKLAGLEVHNLQHRSRQGEDSEENLIMLGVPPSRTYLIDHNWQLFFVL